MNSDLITYVVVVPLKSLILNSYPHCLKKLLKNNNNIPGERPLNSFMYQLISPLCLVLNHQQILS